MNSLLPLWGIAVALLLLALAGLLWPLLQEPGAAAANAATDATADRKRLLRLYRVQREELEREHDRRCLDSEDRVQALEELERRLLDDLDTLPAPTAASDRPWHRRLPAAMLSVLLPLGALSLYLRVGDPLAAATLAMAPPDVHLVEGSDAQAMVARLEERLRQQPDNLEGWLVLARSREVMEQYDAATRAYRQAVELAARQQTAPSFQARIYADLADALASARGGMLDAPVQEELKAALALDAEQPKALALAGTAAARQGDLAGARVYWLRLLGLLEPGSDMALRTQGDLDSLSRVAGASAGDAAHSGTHPALTGALSGSVALDPSLRARIRPGDTVFIVVRAPSAGRMPVGLLRLKADRFPVKFMLDDRHAMSPDRPLSRFANLTVEARVSRSGSTQRLAGEPISRPLPVPAGSRDLVLVVDSLEASAAEPGAGADAKAGEPP